MAKLGFFPSTHPIELRVYREGKCNRVGNSVDIKDWLCSAPHCYTIFACTPFDLSSGSDAKDTHYYPWTESILWVAMVGGAGLQERDYWSFCNKTKVATTPTCIAGSKRFASKSHWCHWQWDFFQECCCTGQIGRRIDGMYHHARWRHRYFFLSLDSIFHVDHGDINNEELLGHE